MASHSVIHSFNTFFYIINPLPEERNQHARRYRRTDNTGNITGHTVIQHMVLGVVLGSDFITYTTRHRHSTQPCCANQRINLLLGEQVEQFHKEDTARDRQGERKETADNDTDSSPVKERLARHGSTHAQSQEDGCRIHNAVGRRIEQAAGIGTYFLNQVTEHQHTNQRHRRRYEKGYNGSNGNREDNLQYTQVLYLGL